MRLVTRLAASAKQTFQVAGAPPAVGPYSQAVAASTTGAPLWVSGQVGAAESDTPGQWAIVDGGVEAETRQALNNVQTILGKAGAGLHNVTKVKVWLTDLEGDFEAMNKAYASFFTGNFPARVCVGVGGLPHHARVQIEAMAALLPSPTKPPKLTQAKVI